MRVLILGGTRFVGKRLVYLLAEQGHHVTVGSRGRASASFPDNIQRVTLDRTRIDSMKKGLEGGEWDLVYDQLCFSADDAATALDVFSGKTGRYVLCSSAAVYTNPVDAAEEEFDPNIFTVSKGNGAGPSYAEGKRQAEAVLFQRASFPVVAARFPIILGPDDYTKRLRVQIQHIANNDPVHIKNPEAEISLISSAEAAAFLACLSTVPDTGPFNACSDGPIALKTIVGFIEEATGRTAVIRRQVDADPFSLFGKPRSATIDAGKARKLGFQFQQTHVWLKTLVQDTRN